MTPCYIGLLGFNNNSRYDSTMDIYLVGGAVRDQLLGINVKDKDWVVVGADAKEMLDAGYKAVGADFPVFLHPQSKEEYALARTERKTKAGYAGFEFYASPDVTLEDDLRRRDLTINAIAQAADGSYIDPYNGQQDIKDKIIRHVSDAFVEDPVRVLRLARFVARFHHLGFTIADETMQLMREIVANGEIDALVAERVWKETSLALSEQSAWRYFEVLRECDALEKIFPELDALFGVPQPKEHHPEIDTGIHTMLVIEQAVRLSSDTRVRFAALCHDFGKALTPKEEWPSHRGHEQRGVALVKALCKRLKVPKDHQEIAVLVTEYHLLFHRADELRANTLLKMLQNLDVFRRPERLELFLLGCEADSRGRPGFEDRELHNADIFYAAYNAAKKIDASLIAKQGLKGPEIAAELQQQRIKAIKKAI